jgi:hypothetical protein
MTIQNSIQDFVQSSSQISTKDHPDLLRVALTLAQGLELLEDEISRLKPLIRELAREQAPETRPNRVVLPVSPQLQGGEVTVTFQRDRVSLDKDFDPQVLKSRLGGVFWELFEEKVSYTPKREILQLQENLPERLQEILKEYLRVSEETPRVGFSFSKSSL